MSKTWQNNSKPPIWACFFTTYGWFMTSFCQHLFKYFPSLLWWSSRHGRSAKESRRKRLESQIQSGWWLMDIDGYWWMLMDIDGYWWILMDIDGYWWILMDIDRYWWILMDIDGYWWMLMDVDGYWWILMDIDGYWWILMDIDGYWQWYWCYYYELLIIIDG